MDVLQQLVSEMVLIDGRATKWEPIFILLKWLLLGFGSSAAEKRGRGINCGMSMSAI